MGSPTGGRRHLPAPLPIEVPLAAGAHVLQLENSGPDWLQLDRVHIPGIGTAVRVQATEAGRAAGTAAWGMKWFESWSWAVDKQCVMSTNPPANRPKTVTLCQLAPGVPAEIFKLGGNEADTQRLRELGFCEAATVKKIAGHSTVMCEVAGTKLAIGKPLAQLIHVHPLTTACGVH